jgi:chloramphenicol 3-O-phosphotransferase
MCLDVFLDDDESIVSFDDILHGRCLMPGENREPARVLAEPFVLRHLDREHLQALAVGALADEVELAGSRTTAIRRREPLVDLPEQDLVLRQPFIAFPHSGLVGPAPVELGSSSDQCLCPGALQTGESHDELEQLGSRDPCLEELVDNERPAALARLQLGFDLLGIGVGLRGEPRRELMTDWVLFHATSYGERDEHGLGEPHSTLSAGQDSPVVNVIWINGSFSAGKTTVAELLVDRMPGSFLLDPEVIGVVLRDHLIPAHLYPGDFQDLPLWRSFTRDAVISAAENSASVIVVPMTVAHPDYFDEIIGEIRKRVRLDHFTLMPSRETILRREATRPDETGDWAAKTVDHVLPELLHDRYAVHLDAENDSAESLAAEILGRVSKP